MKLWVWQMSSCPTLYLRTNEVVLGTGVKIGLAAAHFHSVGVARAGPWNTWVNKEGTKVSVAQRHRRRRPPEPRCPQGRSYGEALALRPDLAGDRKPGSQPPSSPRS